MAISTYDELKASMADWLVRGDLVAAIPTFVSLCEAETNRRLRVREMISRSDALVEAQYTALPGDFLTMKSLYLKTDPVRQMEFVTNEEMQRLKSERIVPGGGKPLYFTVIGATLESLPVPSQAFTGEMIYYGKIPALSASVTSNWLLANHPDVYLYGSLIHSAPYLKNDERALVWSQLFEKGIEQILLADEKAQFSGGVLKARTSRSNSYGWLIFRLP
jgi:hypothetical protein